MPDNRWNIAARSKRPGRLGLFYQSNPPISVQKILIIHIVQRIELILGAHAAVQRLAVAPKLDVLEAASDAPIAVGVKGVEGDRRTHIAAGVLKTMKEVCLYE